MRSTDWNDPGVSFRYRRLHPLKELVARAMDLTCLNALGRLVQRTAFGPHVRVVNYHEILPSAVERFEAQVRYLAEHFSPVSYDELWDLHRGRWNKRRPGLIFSFDDGWQCQAQYAPPILERFGFAGWFAVPVGFVEEPGADFVRAHGCGRDLKPMTWDDVRQLDKRHVVSCHTYTHATLPSGTSADALQRELRYAKGRLEAELGHEVPVFTWVRGRLEDYGPEAAQAVAAAGFRMALVTTAGVARAGFDPLAVPRTNVEPRFPLWLVRYNLSGIPDVVGRRKRRQVERLLAAGQQAAAAARHGSPVAGQAAG